MHRMWLKCWLGQTPFHRRPRMDFIVRGRLQFHRDCVSESHDMEKYVGVVDFAHISPSLLHIRAFMFVLLVRKY